WSQMVGGTGENEASIRHFPDEAAPYPDGRRDRDGHSMAAFRWPRHGTSSNIGAPKGSRPGATAFYTREAMAERKRSTSSSGTACRRCGRSLGSNAFHLVAHSLCPTMAACETSGPVPECRVRALSGLTPPALCGL